MKKALITGINGFVGSHLTNLLLAQSIDVEGLTHPKHSKQTKTFSKNKVKITALNLLNKKLLESFLKKNNYDYIFHLAAFSSPAKSFDHPETTIKNNLFSQLNLLEALKRSKSKILIVGSSEEYGNVDKKYLPINETAPLAPVSPYAVSKVAQDLLGYQFFLNTGLHIVRVRPFNHIGPGQSPNFVISAFASRIAELEKKGENTLKVGNLNTWRDFTDVRDIVKAYLLALEKCSSGEVYNIGSGIPYKIEDILNKLLSLSKTKIKIVVDKSLFRSAEVVKVYCDNTKFRQKTGWQPEIPISKSLFDTIEYERNKLSQSHKSKS